MNEELALRIQEWKAFYEDIFMIDLIESSFIFRALGREEYKQILMMDLGIPEFQEEICRVGILFPEDFDFNKFTAGGPEILSDLIIDASGLHEKQAGALLDEYREEMDNYDYQVDCMIHEAFPEHSIPEIATWPLRKTLYYLSRAEWVLRNLRGVQISIPEPVQQQEEQQPPPQQQFEQQEYQPQEEQNDFAESGAAADEAAVMRMLQQEASKSGKQIPEAEKTMGSFGETSWFKADFELLED